MWNRIGLGVSAACAVAALVWGAGGAIAEKTTSTIAKDCTMDALHQSACIYQLILDDLKATYPFPGGGGIQSIVQKSTTGFVASLGQEERVDEISYDIAIAADGSVSIAGKSGQ